MQNIRIGSALALTGALGLCLTSLPARAQISLTSANPVIQSTSKGGTLTFTATLKNTGTSAFYFLGDDPTFSGPGPTEIGLPASSTSSVVLDDSPFTNILGTSLAAGASQSFTLFNIFAGTTSTAGTYLGHFTIQGNTDPNGAANDAATQDFQVNVGAPVPEASTTASLGVLLALGLGGVVVAARRKKARAV